MKIRPVGTAFFHVGERTDTTKKSRCSQFFILAYASKCSHTSCNKNTLSDTKKLTAVEQIAT